jgi:hypothetical protein
VETVDDVPVVEGAAPPMQEAEVDR